MPFTATKIFKMDMGHRVWNEDLKTARGHELQGKNLLPNKCREIHGHSFIISVTLGSDRLDPQGYVMHTDLFKHPFAKIIEEMDHALVIDKHDPLFEDFKKICEKGNLRLYVVDFSPTFELLTAYFFKKMEEILLSTGKNDIYVSEVQVTVEHMTAVTSFKR